MEMAKQHSLPQVIKGALGISPRSILDTGEGCKKLQLAQHEFSFAIRQLRFGLGRVATTTGFEVDLPVMRSHCYGETCWKAGTESHLRRVPAWTLYSKCSKKSSGVEGLTRGNRPPILSAIPFARRNFSIWKRNSCQSRQLQPGQVESSPFGEEGHRHHPRFRTRALRYDPPVDSYDFLSPSGALQQ